MSRILKDAELSKLLGSVINPADPESLRPNAYVMRLGAEGEFLNAGKQFELGKKKKGVRIPPGHSVAVTAAETLDFRPETIDNIFPGCGLHGFISPTTDLSREGIVAPSTQVDAGYYDIELDADKLVDGGAAFYFSRAAIPSHHFSP
jgi:hypothetical protein